MYVEIVDPDGDKQVAMICNGCEKLSRKYKRPIVEVWEAMMAAGWKQATERALTPTGRRSRRGWTVNYYCPKCVKKRAAKE